MSFPSMYADRIWKDLYSVSVPDNLTIDTNYLRVYGTYTSNDPKYADMMATNFTNVMIPVAKMLEYYVQGIEIRIHSRDNMIRIHKDIELYLEEWREFIRTDIHSSTISPDNKNLIMSLEKLSKDIYAKAKPSEVIDRLINKKKRIGLVTPLAEMRDDEELVKPDYSGIGKLVKSKQAKLDRF